MEITGIAGADRFRSQSRRDLTVFHSQVLFNGKDSNGRSGLWVTSGTAGSTVEIVGSSPNTAATGLSPSDLTVFNSKVFFSGTDSRSTSGQSGHAASGLWVTDGTAANTVELVPGAGPSGLNPYDMTVFGAELLFGATDATGNVGLWETNGTAGGTHVITNIASTPGNLTVLGGKVLFSGVGLNDTSGHTGLWVTDGTAPNTIEQLTVPAPASF